jgi:hypothetical protein
MRKKQRLFWNLLVERCFAAQNDRQLATALPQRQRYDSGSRHTSAPDVHHFCLAKFSAEVFERLSMPAVLGKFSASSFRTVCCRYEATFVAAAMVATSVGIQLVCCTTCEC